MVTLFTSPRPFVDAHTIMIQRNAICSWLALDPTPEVLLIGDDIGVADIARDLSVRHIPRVDTDERGIPMRSSMCQIARDEAAHEYLCIINADIIILDNFYEALRSISLDKYVAAGRRYDLDVGDLIRYDTGVWRATLRDRIHREGTLRGPSTIDYAVYSKGICPPVLPPFPVNSFGWDPWFLFEHKRRRIPVINLTPTVSVVHQNHESPEQVRLKWQAWRRDANAMAALRHVGRFASMMTLREADYEVDSRGLRRPPLGNRLLARMAANRVYREALGYKRMVQGLFH